MSIFSRILRKYVTESTVSQASNKDHIYRPYSISERGNNATQTVLRPDLNMFFEAKENTWHTGNPTGKFPLNMAENNLNWQMMENRIKEVVSNQEMPDWVSGYTGMRGDDLFLDALSKFLEDHHTNIPINPDHLATSAGATAIIELTSWILCDPHDVAVIPAPSYPVYTQDILTKAQIERYDLITHHDIKEIQKSHPLSVRHLEDALHHLKGRGKVFKMLILTSPDNPTGHVYSPHQLNLIASWCIHHKVHLIVNELYALSRINVNNPAIAEDYRGQIEYESVAVLMQKKKSDYIHMIYGLSKDFGMSGLRVGVLYTLNESLLKAYSNINAPHLVSNITQWIISEILSDKSFTTDYIKQNQAKLTASYMIVSTALKKINIPFVAPRGSLFVWLDMSEFLSENTEEEELKLWQSLYDKKGVLLTPGLGFGNSKKGQFRLVHPFVQHDVLEEAMSRLGDFVNEKRV